MVLRLFYIRHYTVSKKLKAELVEGPLATFGAQAISSGVKPTSDFACCESEHKE